MLFSRRYIGWAVLALADVWLPQALQAQEPEVTEIVIRPARVPRPPLAYRLLPRFSDQAPGVAAPLYAQVFLAIRENKIDEETWRKMQDEWINMPLEELPQEEAAEALSQMEAVLQRMDQAARRPSYGLEVPARDSGRILPTVISQVQAFRMAARLLVLQIRLRVLQGDHEGAIRALQTGYAMARHCAEQPTTPNVLVGAALVGMMNHELRELVQSPDAPNLYWALTVLPDPMIDLGPVFDFESIVFESMFPEFERWKTVGATKKQWRELLEKMIRSFYCVEATDEAPANREDVAPPSALESIGVDVLIEKGLPLARRNLLAAGVPRAKLDMMSPEETAVRAAFEDYRNQCEELAKWCRVPYWKAKPGIERTMDRARRLLEEAGLTAGATYLTQPGYDLQYHHMAAARPRRYLAGLRCVEAIRLYAAEHDGRLPQRLEDVTQVPIPVNPMTGKLFLYRAEERYVILDLDGDVFNRQWWIRLAD